MVSTCPLPEKETKAQGEDGSGLGIPKRVANRAGRDPGLFLTLWRVFLAPGCESGNDQGGDSLIA